MRQRPALVLQIVWAAVLSGLVIFSAFVAVIGSSASGRVAAMDPEGVMVITLNAWAVGMALAAWFLPRWMWRRAAHKVEGAGDPELCRAYMTPFVVRLALFEGIAILGIVVSTALVDPTLFVRFLLLSAVGLAAAFPTLGRVQRTFIK